MCDECYCCTRPAFAAGELRFTTVAELGGADVLICRDCHSQVSEDHPDWSTLKTADEVADEFNAAHEMAMDDRAHAARDRRAGL